MPEQFKVVSCPNCGGDDEPWYMRIQRPRVKAYVQTCGKCNHRFIYRNDDVLDWFTARRAK